MATQLASELEKSVKSSLIQAMDKRGQEQKVRADVDHIHVKCPGCAGSRNSQQRRNDGKPLPCKTCNGKGSVSLAWFKQHNPEKYEQQRKLHAGEW